MRYPCRFRITKCFVKHLRRNISDIKSGQRDFDSAVRGLCLLLFCGRVLLADFL